jgi:hypothetical protein
LNATIDIRTLIFKRAAIQGVFSVPNLYFEEAVGVLRRHGDRLRAIIQRRIDAAKLETWFREWSERPNFDGKTIVNFKDATCFAGH